MGTEMDKLVADRLLELKAMLTRMDAMLDLLVFKKKTEKP